jgi:hypothetical protein
MIFKPERIHCMWDSWMTYHENKYYLYTLDMGQTERQGWHGQGVDMATSRDGVHWEEVGVVLRKEEGATGLGTGTIWKAEDFERSGKFIMNYSVFFDWCVQSQNIRFAESTDLIHWEKLGEEFEFKQDPRWYETYPEYPEARWDTITTIPRPQGGRYGYWTAYPKGRVGFGFGETTDGTHWESLFPPVVENPVSGDPSAIERIGDRYYMLYCGGWSTLVADRPEGPFRQVEKNGRLLVGDAYFMRLLPVQDELLVYFHTIPRTRQHDRNEDVLPTESDWQWSIRNGLVELAPLQKAVVDGEGVLRLGYWPGNDALKRTPIGLKRGETRTLHGIELDLFWNRFPVDQGIVLEGSLPLMPASEGDLGTLAEKGRFSAMREEEPDPQAAFWNQCKPFSGVEAPFRDGCPCGLFFEFEENRGSYFALGKDGIAEIGQLDLDRRTILPEWRVDRAMLPGSPAGFRVLFKDSVVLVYVDDVLYIVYGLPHPSTGRIGFVGRRDAAMDYACRAWSF